MNDIVKKQVDVIAGRKVELTSLSKMKAAFTTQAVLILDRSGSMSDATNDGRRKIDALRDLVMDLRQKAGFEQLVFDDQVEWTEDIGEPRGGTQLHRALSEARTHRPDATRYILICDGQPDSQEMALHEASLMPAPIDVFYVGPLNDHYAQDFLKQLAQGAKGQFGAADLSSPMLEEKIRLALNPGTEEDIKRGPIAL